MIQHLWVRDLRSGELDSIGNKKEKRKITYITTKKDKNGNRVISDIKIK